jgi:ABC-2 type transport system ATP-binding protein
MNGAGKSTLFRTIAGILKPAHGSVHVGGYAVGSPHRLPVGYMTVRPLLYRRITGYENLRYVAHLYHVPNVDERIEMLVERVGLSDRLHSYVEQYSTGMMARLDLARTLLPNPPLLLLDEPFWAFDVRFAEEAREIIRESHATVLLATHNLADIEKLTHRIILLHEGRLIRDVAFEELSEVAPVHKAKTLTIVEFVDILLRRSVAPDHQPGHRSLHRKYVLSS